MSSHPAQRSHCQNCGNELKGPYCHHCGQHDFDAHTSFGHAVHEFLESFFHWDGKFFKGLYELLFRPGFLTVAYNSGRRASQMPPLRFYIFVSLIFFLCPSPSDSVEPEETVQGIEQTDLDKGLAKLEQDLKAKNANKSSLQIDGDGAALVGIAREKLSHADQIQERFHHFLPRAMLVCLPLFALMSLFVFRKSGYSFLQHLVLSMHLHTFFFLFSLTWSGWRQLAGLFSPLLAGYLYFLGCLYIAVYAYLTLRRVFGGMRHRGTLLRGGFLLGSYACVVGLVLLVTISIATWLS